MRQYTSESQTTNLIELGFDKPKSEVECDLPKGDWRIGAKGIRRAYSIGELLSFLPTTITDRIWWGEDKGQEGVWGLRIDTGATDYGWDVSYERDRSAYLHREGRSELIDALYDMIIKLKEEGVI